MLLVVLLSTQSIVVMVHWNDTHPGNISLFRIDLFRIDLLSLSPPFTGTGLNWNLILAFDLQGYTRLCGRAIVVTRTTHMRLIEHSQGTHNDMEGRIGWDFVPKTIPSQKDLRYFDNKKKPGIVYGDAGFFLNDHRQPWTVFHRDLRTCTYVHRPVSLIIRKKYGACDGWWGKDTI